MKAIVQDVYGPPLEVLRSDEIPTPEIRDDEVLIAVRAAAVRIGISFAVRGAPFLARMATGLRRPKVGVPGFDVCGEVVAVGSRVTRFAVGDKVFGSGSGACAEFARARDKDLAPKPERLTYEEAAAIPTSGLAALHGLRDAGRLQRGQHVLINGASGGVGTFAVQIAKHLGAEVTGVCSTRNVELLRDLGADHVIDYTKQDFTTDETRYDVIMDNVENKPLGAVRRVLKPNGTLVLNSGTGASGLRLIIRLLKPIALNPFVSQRLRRYLSSPKQADLEFLGELVGLGKLRPVVGPVFPLSQTASALQHVEAGHARGNVVIAVATA